MTPCKNYSLSLLSPFNNSGGFGKSDNGFHTVPPTEVSWMSPIQLESEQFEQISLFNMNNTSNITTKYFAMKKAVPEVDLLLTNPFFIFITVLSCIGNLAIITLICSLSKFRKPANLLIANLSISSLLLIVSVNIRYMEFSIDLWKYSNSWCRILAVLHRLPMPLVSMTTMSISFDRGRVARNPLTRTCMNPIWRVIFIWCFSLIIAFPLGFSRKFDACYPTHYKCSKTLLLNSTFVTVIYAVLFLSLVFLIPSFILVQESTKTLRKIQFLRASVITWSVNRVGVQIFPTNHRLRLLKNSCVYSCIFLVFWLPYGFAQFLLDSPQNLIPDILIAYSQYYVKVLKNYTYMQVVLNPVILFMLSYDFGIYCKRFKGKCPFNA